MRRDFVSTGCALAALACAAPAVAHDYGAWSADIPNPSWESFGKAPAPEMPRRDGARLVQLPAPAVASPGAFEQVGHEPLRNRGMNAALAVHGNYAYVGYRSDGTHLDAGVMVVDVSNPSTPRIVSEIGPPNEGNIAESSRELRVLPDQNLLLVLNHACSELIHRCVNPSQTGVSLMPSTVRFYDIAGAKGAAPELVATYLPSRSAPQQPHEFFLWTDPKDPKRVLLYSSTPSTDASRDANMVVTDISKARENVFNEISAWVNVIGNPERDNRMHSLTVSHDGRRAYLPYLGGGFLVADTSDFADNRPNPEVKLVTPVENRVFWTDPGAHSAIKLYGRDYVLVTDEVYGEFGGVLAGHGCPWGWVRMIDIADPTKPRIAAEYKLPSNDEKICASVDPVRDNFSSFASHNPTLTRNLALITWHSAGLQAVSLADPLNPASAAQFLPTPLPFVATEDPALSQGTDKVVMWSFPIIKDGLIYVVDLRNGLYILRYKGPFEDEVASARLLDGNSNSGDVARLEQAAATRPPCLPRPLRLSSRGVGAARLGLSRNELASRVGSPRKRVRGLRFCVEGPGDVFVALSSRGRARLVVTDAREDGALSGTRAVQIGTPLSSLRIAYPKLRTVTRNVQVAGSLVFGTRGGRVRFAGAADRATRSSARALRSALASVGL